MVIYIQNTIISIYPMVFAWIKEMGEINITARYGSFEKHGVIHVIEQASNMTEKEPEKCT